MYSNVSIALKELKKIWKPVPALDPRHLIRTLTVYIALLIVALGHLVLATSYKMISDADLADQAELIIVGKITSYETGILTRPITRYKIQVEEVLKGSASPGTLTVDVTGGESNDGTQLILFGSPVLHLGDRSILFLVSNLDGTFAILHLALGVFVETKYGEKTIAYRSLQEMSDRDRSSSTSQQFKHPRDFRMFTNWLSSRARSVTRNMDYFVPISGSFVFQNFTIQGLGVARFFEFDTNQAVTFRLHEDGQPGLTDGGTTEFQEALNAWNEVPNTNVNYILGDTTSSTSGFTKDGINAIIFEDPNNEIPGTFTCPGGGILGAGGFSTSGVDVFKGQTYARIIEVNIVMNDGVECTFGDSGGSLRAQEVYAHELGHTLGLGHSCGEFMSCTNPVFDQALMRASAHFDGRGSKLSPDDRAGLTYLYSSLNPFGNLIFAEYAEGTLDGTANRTRIILKNQGPSSDTGTIDFLSESGITLKSLSYTIQPGGVFETETSGTGNLVVGPLEVTSHLGESSGLEGTLIFDILGHFVSVGDSSLSALTQIFVSRNETENTGVALYNPDKTSQITLNLTLSNAMGTVQKTRQLHLGAGQQIARFIDQAEFFQSFFNANPENFTGTMKIQSTSGALFSTLSLLQKLDTGALIAVPHSNNTMP